MLITFGAYSPLAYKRLFNAQYLPSMVKIPGINRLMEGPCPTETDTHTDATYVSGVAAGLQWEHFLDRSSLRAEPTGAAEGDR